MAANDMKRDKAPAQLVKMSRAVGGNPALVLGTFGNTSAKTRDGGSMYIKASGTELKAMTMSKGFRRLSVDSVLTIMKDRSLGRLGVYAREAEVTRRLLEACNDRGVTRVRPSIESCFHAMLDRYVVHLHPVAVLAYACAKNGRAAIESLFANQKCRPIWVDFGNPGYGLAVQVRRAVDSYAERFGTIPSAMVLQNHGLVTTSASADTAVRLARRIVRLCSAGLKDRAAPMAAAVNKQNAAQACLEIGGAIGEVSGKKVRVHHFPDKHIAAFMKRSNARALCSKPAITPDELIYIDGPVMWLEKSDTQLVVRQIERRLSCGQLIPRAFLVRDVGLFVTGDGNIDLARDVACACLMIRAFATDMGGIRALNKSQRAFINTIANKTTNSP